MSTTKKQWVKPELIVLARGRPEEAVLKNCKGPSKSGDYASKQSGCNDNNSCGNCDTPRYS
jgi:hypothetical protein